MSEIAKIFLTAAAAVMGGFVLIVLKRAFEERWPTHATFMDNTTAWLIDRWPILVAPLVLGIAWFTWVAPSPMDKGTVVLLVMSTAAVFMCVVLDTAIRLQRQIDALRARATLPSRPEPSAE